MPPVFKNNSAKSGRLFQNHPYQTFAGSLTGDPLRIADKSPQRAMSAFLSSQKKRIKSQKINKQITYSDTTKEKHPEVNRKMTIHATSDFLKEMSGQPLLDQLMMLNWSQWIDLKDVKFTKVLVRASQRGKGKIKFQAFFVAETDKMIIRFGKRSQTSEVTMYHMAKKRK